MEVKKKLTGSPSYFDVYQSQSTPTSKISNSKITTTATSTTSASSLSKSNSVQPSSLTRSSSLYGQIDRNGIDIRDEQNSSANGKGLMPRTKASTSSSNRSSSVSSYNSRSYSASSRNEGTSRLNTWKNPLDSSIYESMTSQVMHRQLFTKEDSTKEDSILSTSRAASLDLPRSHNFSRPSSARLSSHSLTSTHSNVLPSSSSKRSLDAITSQQRFSFSGPTIRRSNNIVSRRSISPTPLPLSTAVDEELDQSRSSIDSLEEELKQSLKFSPLLSSARISSNAGHLSDASSVPSQSLTPSRSKHYSTSPSPSSRNLTPSPSFQNLTSELAELLKSPRLTRIIPLTQSTNQNVKVSLADVGLQTGHPVLISLGLGCSRHLIGLYDELALALGLRLICIDRWGIGQTTEIEEDGRDFLKWASIVEEVLSDHLGVREYSMLAHSAGSPYALASAVLNPRKVKGRIHLLAPWVSTEVESLVGTYRLLKFFPTGVLKKVQEVEWKVQEWKIGRPPMMKPELGIGFDKNSTSSSTSSDQLDDGTLFSSIAPSGTTAFNTRAPLSGLIRSSSLPVLPLRLLQAITPPSFNNLTSSSSSRNLYTSTTTSPPSSPPLPPPPLTSTPSKSNPTQSYANALLQASHSESLSGTTSDLKVLLSKTDPGYKYSEIENEVKIWLGERDERISLGSIRSLEKEFGKCKVEIVEGGTHNLMTNSKIMIEIFESIAEDWKS